VDAAILAGGRARRFGGRDKASLHVGRGSILDRQLAALRAVADRIVLVTADPARYRDKHVHAVTDLLPGAGALGGIYTALATATTDQVLVVACDLPFLTGAFLGCLAALGVGPDEDAVVPRSQDGLQPLCAVYSRRLLEPMRQQIATGHLKIVDFLATVRVRELQPHDLAEYDPEGTLFFNVNGPAELERANELAARHRL
jgi:molybdopterin-guanine dinucleotide biosynthesis protein A